MVKFIVFNANFNNILRDYMVVGFTTNCEFESSSNKVYSIQHYVIKFVSDLWQVSGFLRVLRLPPPIKLTAPV